MMQVSEGQQILLPSARHLEERLTVSQTTLGLNSGSLWICLGQVRGWQRRIRLTLVPGIPEASPRFV